MYGSIDQNSKENSEITPKFRDVSPTMCSEMLLSLLLPFLPF